MACLLWLVIGTDVQSSSVCLWGQWWEVWDPWPHGQSWGWSFFSEAFWVHFQVSFFWYYKFSGATLHQPYTRSLLKFQDVFSSYSIWYWQLETDLEGDVRTMEIGKGNNQRVCCQTFVTTRPWILLFWRPCCDFTLSEIPCLPLPDFHSLPWLACSWKQPLPVDP